MSPIKGEINIAPMMTAGLLSARPSAAMPAEKTISNQ
jgi:hypothetical protein